MGKRRPEPGAVVYSRAGQWFPHPHVLIPAAGQVWDAADPIVLAYPGEFTADPWEVPGLVRSSRPPQDPALVLEAAQLADAEATILRGRPAGAVEALALTRGAPRPGTRGRRGGSSETR